MHCDSHYINEFLKKEQESYKVFSIATQNVKRHNAVMVFGITNLLRVASDFKTHAQDERGKKTGGRKKQQHRHKHWWKKE